MNVSQFQWSESTGWSPVAPPHVGSSQSILITVFGAPNVLARPQVLSQLVEKYPEGIIVGCSTAGEIVDVAVKDDSAVATVMAFEKSLVEVARTSLHAANESFDAGKLLANRLPRTMTSDAGAVMPLKHVFVLSDGLVVNGTALVAGLTKGLPTDVSVTGGLAGDGARFAKTVVVDGGELHEHAVVAVGLYGEALQIGFGSLGGWDPFGPERLVTKAQDNVLYEFDGRSALEVYKHYLGRHAADLPASALLFPMSLRMPWGGDPLVRTVLGIDETSQSMTFAGDVPEGAYARLMKANFDRLIDGAADAARTSVAALNDGTAEVALLISCVGRKLLLRQRIEEEVEGVREVLGPRPTLAGFYSYGEISPFSAGASCELHNQTMTITTLREV
ncbi:FIST signal transduction protein [Synoicihabitans lomoniglobus]|uniref:FIST N-terminal domain-containing protein n=1 Tax=Synoicihabitans lomoniglobus TaxID=2909285 RepID=A0AAF0CPU4_9BACT|nr:FIST C-terminal domain-containing protein [Opitutaceae bacterium LMO-M01]WED65840.1 FIST N-terminal domain-containing protein [Opitutaceae bacterium LMO-M01]